MKYLVLCLWVMTAYAKETRRHCQKGYVYCRAQAQACGNFRKRLKECQKEYTTCKKNVKELRKDACQYDWYNSFYFLG